MVGRTLSHYRITAQLGAGGMGVVYRAEDIRLGREVALKFVSEEVAHDEQAVIRLRSEARAASALNHPNICTIYDIGEDEGHPFIVMELMKGQTLRDRLLSGPLKVHQLVDIGIEIADALHADPHRRHHPSRHQAGEHLPDRSRAREDPGLRPGQAHAALLRIEHDLRAVADRTGVGVTIGTVSYMSPEQAAGEELDGRTDLFSLGVVLYECATGRHPFPGKTTAVILAAILNRTPVGAGDDQSGAAAAAAGGHQQLPREGSRAALSVGGRPARRSEAVAPRHRVGPLPAGGGGVERARRQSSDRPGETEPRRACPSSGHARRGRPPAPSPHIVVSWRAVADLRRSSAAGAYGMVACHRGSAGGPGPGAAPTERRASMRPLGAGAQPVSRHGTTVRRWPTRRPCSRSTPGTSRRGASATRRGPRWRASTRRSPRRDGTWPAATSRPPPAAWRPRAPWMARRRASPRSAARLSDLARERDARRSRRRRSRQASGSPPASCARRRPAQQLPPPRCRSVVLRPRRPAPAPTEPAEPPRATRFPSRRLAVTSPPVASRSRRRQSPAPGSGGDSSASG